MNRKLIVLNLLLVEIARDMMVVLSGFYININTF